VLFWSNELIRIRCTVSVCADQLASRNRLEVTESCKQYSVFITHAGIATGMGRAFSRVCMFVHVLKGKRLELSTPNLVLAYSIAAARHALTQSSKGQGHTITKTVTVHYY